MMLSLFPYVHLSCTYLLWCTSKVFLFCFKVWELAYFENWVVYFCIWVVWHATVHVWMSKNNLWKWEWIDLWPPCLGVFPLQRFLLCLLHSWPWHLDSFLGSGYQTQVVKLTCPNSQIFLFSKPSPQFLFVFETICFCWRWLRTPDLQVSLKYLDIKSIPPYSDLFIYVCMCVQVHIAHVLR